MIKRCASREFVFKESLHSCPGWNERLLRLLGLFGILISAVCADSSFGWADESEDRIDSAGIRARITNSSTPATLSLHALGRFEVRIDVEPQGEPGQIEINVELDETGPNTWPAEEIYIAAGDGELLPIRRNGIDWHRLEMTVPPVRRSYVIKTAIEKNAGSGMRLPSEAEREVRDISKGIGVSICRWYGGREAALSLRFDDSYPSHLTKVMPALREFDFKATFMINPGRAGYTRFRKEWEAHARAGKHEFANHTLHHRGARDASEIEREIGEVSEYLWALFPEKSQLLALNRGGGTVWTTRRPFSEYLEKYHLFHVSGSLGMDDVYGKRVAALRRHLERHIDSAGWCRVHFHSIGPDLATSEPNFRAAIELVREYERSLWIAGLADVYKYQAERKAAKLTLRRDAEGRFLLRVHCQTDPELYDQRLTLRLTLSPQWPPGGISLVSEGVEIAPSALNASSSGGQVALFDVPPVSAEYVIMKSE